MQWNSQRGGYSNLLVSFDQLLLHHRGAGSSVKLLESQLMANLQSLLQDTSSLMYDALGSRAYLSDAQILIPLSWNSSLHELLPKPNYPVLRDRRVKFSSADIVIGFDCK